MTDHRAEAEQWLGTAKRQVGAKGYHATPADCAAIATTHLLLAVLDAVAEDDLADTIERPVFQAYGLAVPND